MKDVEWHESERRESLRRMRLIVFVAAIFAAALWWMTVNLRS